MSAAGLLWRQYRFERRLFWRNPSAAFFNFELVARQNEALQRSTGLGFFITKPWERVGSNRLQACGLSLEACALGNFA